MYVAVFLLFFFFKHYGISVTLLLGYADYINIILQDIHFDQSSVHTRQCLHQKEVNFSKDHIGKIEEVWLVKPVSFINLTFNLR